MQFTACACSHPESRCGHCRPTTGGTHYCGGLSTASKLCSPSLYICTYMYVDDKEVLI